MKKNVKRILLFSISLLSFNACKQDTEVSVMSKISPKNEELLIPTTARLSNENALRATNEIVTNTDAEEFAKLLALSLKDKDFRSFIKNEANKQFDGDYDILVNKVLNSKVGNDKFAERIKQNSSNGQKIIDNALKDVLLNISIPLFIEKWNTDKEIPLVAVSVGSTESKTKQLKAFDKNGKTYLIDSNNEPNLPVIIVGHCERVDNNGIIRNYISSSLKNSRPDNSSEYLYSFRTENLSNMESWIYGKPEIKCVISGVRNGTPITTIWLGGWNPSRSSVDGNNYVPNVFTFTWTPDYGNYLTYTWIEEDYAGPDRDVSVPLTYQTVNNGTTVSFTTTFTKREEDKTIAQNQIWKGEPRMQQYNGDYTFSFKLEFL